MTTRPEAVDFCALSLVNRIATTDDGQDYPIIDLWDEFGQDTDEVAEVAFVVVQLAPDWVVGINMDDFEEAPLN